MTARTPMHPLEETIVAPITALGGAVALLRVSGPSAWQVASRVAQGGEATRWAPGRSHYVRWVTGDDGLLLLFEEGSGFTGERAAELSCHGSRAAVTALLEACVSAGARPAEPGEFSYRAFMNGRIDLTQAEGVRDTVEALTAAQLRQASRLRQGGLRDQVQESAAKLLLVIGAIEASVDFSEEVGELDRKLAVGRLTEVAESLQKVQAGSDRALLLREGLTVVLMGLPNAGKSSLLNAVLRSERAIVSETPGTTRDTVEELVEVNGLPVRFVDTAGLCEATDPVEKIGVARSRAAAETADRIWYVYDSSKGWTDADEQAWESLSGCKTQIANKCDLQTPARPLPGILVSALTGQGLNEALQTLGGQGLDEGPLLNRRHGPLVASALESVTAAIATLTEPVPDDLAVVHLRSALRSLGEVTGESASPEMVEDLFKGFCLGK